MASWCARTLSGHHPPQAPRQGWFQSVSGPQDLCELIRSLGALEKPRSQLCHFVGGPLAWPGSLLEMPVRDGGVPHPGDENLQLTKILRGLEYTPHCKNAALTRWSESPRPGASHPQLHIRIVVVGRQELFKTPMPVPPHRTLFQGARHRQFQALPSISGARVETHSLRPPTCAQDEDRAESQLGLSQMTQSPTQ